MYLCVGSELAGEGESQDFDPKEIVGMLKQKCSWLFKYALLPR